jgi:uncharacterized protein (DUF58 family)
MKPPAFNQRTLKPNKMGIGFIILVIAMLLAAINYGNNIIFFISFLLISLMGNSAWQTRRQLNSCSLSVFAIAPRHANESGVWQIQLSSQLPNPAITIKALGADSVVCALPAATTMRVDLPLAPLPRGNYPAPIILLSTQYPIGLWTAERAFHWAGQRQWIYPAPQGNAPFPRADLVGKKPATPVAANQGDEQFDHLRAYTAGDALNRIAFKQFAKTGQLVTQHWQSDLTASDEIQINFNQMAGSIEANISQITQWVLQLSTLHIAFTLNLPGHAILRGHDARHRQQCLEALALFLAPPVQNQGAR